MISSLSLSLTSRMLDQRVKRPFMYINCQLLHPLPLPVVLLNANHVTQKKNIDSFNFRDAYISSCKTGVTNTRRRCLAASTVRFKQFWRNGKNFARFPGPADNPVCICRWGNLERVNRIWNPVCSLLIAKFLPSTVSVVQASLTASFLHRTFSVLCLQL